jgi:hypothetical protein
MVKPPARKTPAVCCCCRLLLLLSALLCGASDFLCLCRVVAHTVCTCHHLLRV